MRWKSPLVIASAGVSQLPPHASTAGTARYSCRFFADTPPVGMNSTSRNTAAKALIIATPPAWPAGKNFNIRSPRFHACCASVAVATPGITGTDSSCATATTSSCKPGETMNLAPAATIIRACSPLSTVPAPTKASGTSFAIAEIASAAAAVRIVISMTGSPPATSEVATGTALDASSRTTTGTTGAVSSKFSHWRIRRKTIRR